MRQVVIVAFSFTVGLFGNVLANDIGYWSIAAVLLVALSFAAVWLHSRPGSAIARAVLWTLLALALAATLLAAALPPPWAGYATLAAAVLIAVALLIPASGHALQLLVGMGMVGGAAAVAASAIGYLAAGQGSTLFNITVLVFALAGAGAGLGLVIGPKDVVARLEHVPLGTLSDLGVGMAVIVGGVMMALTGLAHISVDDVWVGLALVGVGVTIAGAAVAARANRAGLMWWAFIGSGVAVACAGTANLLDNHEVLLGTTGIATGGALAALAFTASGLGRQAEAWWERITHDASE
ncbi:hypothetical protein [Acrocarpospora phusangensis]|uniref:hypothetical protein n=1 Tax=Acrocarpospora phusangensis TaxID=1070424 RepID=UPI001951B8DF|nr:hypothetical protein [Acrocarpospora phusangensis]